MPPRRATARPQTRSSARSTCRSRPGAVTDGQQCTVYLDAIVGKDNIGSVARVPGANYDKQTGAAAYAKTPDYFTYQYDTGARPAVHGRVF